VVKFYKDGMVQALTFA